MNLLEKTLDYMESVKATANRSAMEYVCMIIDLLEDGKDDFLIVEAAGNGYGNVYGAGGYDVRMSGALCNITPELYQMFSQKTREELEKKGITYDTVKEHVMIVSGISNTKKIQHYTLNSSYCYGDMVDICAPAGSWNNDNSDLEIYSTVANVDGNTKNDAYGYMFGTSMAAPMVSGSAALLWSIDPSLSAGEVKEYLMNTKYVADGTSKGDNRQAYPMLNIGESVIRLIDKLDAPKCKEELEKYAQSLDCTYGETTRGYFEKQYDRGYVSSEHKVSNLDNRSIGYLLHDFDGDQREELLVVRTNKDAGVVLEMYEYTGGKVVLSAEKDLSYCTYPFTLNMSVDGYGLTPGIFDCYIFGNDKVNIAIEMGDSSSFVADGFLFNYLILNYNGDTFQENAYKYYCGSEFFQEEEGEGFIRELNAAGIYSDSYEDLVYRDQHTIDQIEYVKEFVRCKQTSTLTYDSFSAYRDNTSMTEIDSCEFYFYPQSELRDNYQPFAEGDSSKISMTNNHQVVELSDMNIEIHLGYSIEREYLSLHAVDKYGTPLWDIMTGFHSEMDSVGFDEIMISNDIIEFNDNRKHTILSTRTGRLVWKEY